VPLLPDGEAPRTVANRLALEELGGPHSSAVGRRTTRMLPRVAAAGKRCHRPRELPGRRSETETTPSRTSSGVASLTRSRLLDRRRLHPAAQRGPQRAVTDRSASGARAAVYPAISPHLAPDVPSSLALDLVVRLARSRAGRSLRRVAHSTLQRDWRHARSRVQDRAVRTPGRQTLAG
jgi:hypothetical protein